jgi:hypothetical protein
MENNYIAPSDKGWVDIVVDMKKKGKFDEKTYFPLDTYDMVQIGYPRPDHGEMIHRPFGGTDEKGNLMSPNGMWCKREDVEKLLKLNAKV